MIDISNERKCRGVPRRILPCIAYHCDLTAPYSPSITTWQVTLAKPIIK